ncbi:MAG: PD-(D/E)XK nuclease family protein [Acidimicrobiales bacterium]
MASTATRELNPAQQRVRAVLGSGGGELPEFEADLGERLRATLEAGVGPLVSDLGSDDTLIVSKHLLSSVHGCEARMLAEDGAAFEVTVPIARGSVAHKAIELAIHWKGEPVPLDLVDEAVGCVTESDHWLADWLRTCGDTARAEVRSEAGDRVSKFLECFPPLRPGWRPVTESRLTVELCGGRIRLTGKVDLTIGVAEGMRAGKVIIDLKSGAAGLYTATICASALLEAIASGCRLDWWPATTSTRVSPTPSWSRSVCWRPHWPARSTAPAASSTCETAPSAPVKRTGFPCRWCRILAGCDEGKAHLRSIDDFEDLDSA